MKEKRWIIGTVAVAALLIALAVGTMFLPREELAPAPSTQEECTLFYVDETAKIENQPFSLWCPTTGWVDLAADPLP